jgi:hypothetical protein
MIAFVLDVRKAISSIGIFLVICCPGTHCLEPVEVKLYPRCAPGQTMPLFLGNRLALWLVTWCCLSCSWRCPRDATNLLPAFHQCFNLLEYLDSRQDNNQFYQRRGLPTPVTASPSLRALMPPRLVPPTPEPTKVQHNSLASGYPFRFESRPCSSLRLWS